jgi:hypothetical protein
VLSFLLLKVLPGKFLTAAEDGAKAGSWFDFRVATGGNENIFVGSIHWISPIYEELNIHEARLIDPV